jgi:hypothetical protein
LFTQNQLLKAPPQTGPFFMDNFPGCILGFLNFPFMKKMIIVLAAGIITTAAVAQQNVTQAPPPPPPEMKQLPPPPPPPVAPKVPVVKSSKGYIITVMENKGDNIVVLKKNGVVQKIRMSIWNAKPEYFENKYGLLPPPPPPPLPNAAAKQINN